MSQPQICCFFCIMKEQDSSMRRSKIQEYLKGIPFLDDEQLILVVSELWSLAMTRPDDDDDELVSLGLFECMAVLMNKAMKNRSWLLKHQNIYIPYYAAHIVGSYTMNRDEFAAMAVEAGVVEPLVELLRGRKMSWVEQRVAVRALGHLASYERTFEAVAGYEEEVVKLAMNLVSSCLEQVYSNFFRDRVRVRYQCDLMSRGVGGEEKERRKAEEWASQLQLWSIHLLACFAVKERCLDLICKREFLEALCGVWGGLANHASPAGIGLIRILCYKRFGRESVSRSKLVIENLCNVARSSDDWQYMGIDCLLLLLKNKDTRFNVMESSAHYLIDLIELRNLGNRRNLGDSITRALLVHGFKNSRIEKSLEFVWQLKVERRKIEKLMSQEKLLERRMLVKVMKQEGNHHFLVGNLGEALFKYGEALEMCPLRHRKERVVIYSNRAQCHLVLRDADAAISDATRALCLSSPPNSHAQSLWIRAQAYDMKGMAKESLMDCVVFIKSGAGFGLKVSYYAVRMISKQMEKTWLFREARIKAKEEENCKINYGTGLSTILEEPGVVKDGIRRKKMERVIRRSNKSV